MPNTAVANKRAHRTSKEQNLFGGIAQSQKLSLCLAHEQLRQKLGTSLVFSKEIHSNI